MLHLRIGSFFGQCAAASRMHEAVNAFMVAVVSAERNCRYINPNQAIEKLHPNFADECSILSLRFENPARILQKLP